MLAFVFEKSTQNFALQQLLSLGINTDMTNEVATQTPPALALKGGLFTLTAIQLYQIDLMAISETLDNKIQQAPNFFQNTPIILDLSLISNINSDQLLALIQLFKHRQLIPVGIRTTQATIKKLAVEMGLAIMPETKLSPPSESKKIKNISSPSITHSITYTESENDSAEKNSVTGSRLFTAPVRSGQQVYALNGDLVVLSSVSHGAELLSEGHIHVHGSLRGRALAGVNGDKSAIIYCKSLEAELVSIAGQYKIIEDLKESNLWKRSVCIRLVDNRLQIEAL